MGTSLGRPDSPLAGSPLERMLAAQPHRFAFYQAVRLLERFSGRRPVGAFAPHGEEAVRFAGNVALSFPPSEIRDLVPRGDPPPGMRVNFFGLYGALGVLPHVYTEYLLERLQARDTALCDFYDMFNHRLVALMYRAWLKYRFGMVWERSGEEPVTRELLCLLGLGSEGLQQRLAVPDEAIIFYAGLFSRQVRSAAGLEAMLADYFDVDTAVIPFAGAWRTLDTASRTRFGDDESPSLRLGEGAVLSDEVWDQQSTVRVRLGPLRIVRYLSFLPGGDAHAPLKALCRLYCGEDVDVEVQLVLDRRDVPRLGLDTPGEAPRLGWVSWIVSKPPERDAEDTILRLWN